MLNNFSVWLRTGSNPLILLLNKSFNKQNDVIKNHLNVMNFFQIVILKNPQKQSFVLNEKETFH